MTDTKPGRDYRVRTDCRLCGGPLATRLALGNTPLANELVDRQDAEQDTFPLYLAQCAICQHVQLPVVVNPERLFQRGYVYQSGTSPEFVKYLQAFARDVQPARAGGFVLEVASNDGCLLAEYQRLGFSVLGIDPAHNAADVAEARRVPTIRAFFGHATLANWNLAGRKADLVIALNVMAHIDDLSDVLIGICALLSDDGKFVMEVGYLPDMISRGVWRVCYHEHLSYHHIAPLVNFFASHGLEIVDAHRVPTQGGSIRVFSQRAHS
jgi:SAM-dependent methyltransferase